MERSEVEKEKFWVKTMDMQHYYLGCIEKIFPNVDGSDAFDLIIRDREHKLYKQAYIYCLNRHITRTDIADITDFSKTAIQNALSKWNRYKKKGFPYKEHINKFQKVLAIPEYGR